MRARRKDYQKAYREAHKEKLRAQASTYYRSHRAEYKAKRRESRLKREYGLSLVAYMAMVDAQQGRCAICGELRQLYVDHCHKTGSIRKLLCHQCNVGFGLFNEKFDTLMRAAEYAREFGKDEQ